MVHAEDVLLVALTFKGHGYQFGYELNPKAQPKPTDKPDCSELVQYSCEHLGVEMVDGAANQYEFCKHHGTLIPISVALKTRGSLMFITEPDGHIGHVVFSVPVGSTMEAKGHDYGCGEFSAFRHDGHTPRFDKAALIPGVDYSAAHAPLPARPDGKRPVLKAGMHGPYVHLLQQLLHDHGHAMLVVDGNFGPKTTSAVAAFQSDHGLAVDGIAGDHVWSTLLNLTGRPH